jgi:hypothetical protein
LFIFCIGFWLGSKKVRHLTEEIYGLQRDVLDLNAEILYGRNDEIKSATPVIGIQHDAHKGAKLAK